MFRWTALVLVLEHGAQCESPTTASLSHLTHFTLSRSKKLVSAFFEILSCEAREARNGYT